MIQRRTTVFGLAKKSTIHPDSPKTREACLALGYDLSIFKLKKEENFKGEDDKITKLRYDHYLQKLEIAYKEITEKRKQIIKKQNALTNIHLDKSFQKDEGIVNELIETYNKKMTTLNEEIKDNNSFESFDDKDPILVLEDHLEKEIYKYKKALGVKAKEIQHQLDNEKKRHQLQQDMEIKKKQMKEQQDKILKEKQLKQKKKQQDALQKFTNIKNKEKEFSQKQIQERKCQIEKFEELRRKQKLDQEIKKNQIEEHEKQQQIKYATVQANKQKQNQLFDNQLTLTLTNLQSKQLECSFNKDKFTWESKLEKLSMRGTNYDEKLKRIKQQTEQKEAETIQKVVSKLFKNEQELEMLEKQRVQQEQQKQKEETTKRKRIQDKLQRIQSLQLQRISDLEKQFKDQELYSCRKRDEQELQQYWKKEKLKLKKQDLFENYQRQERLKDLRFKQTISDNLSLNEQKSLEKLQQELVRKAQQELQRKLKKQHEELDHSLLNVSQADKKNINILVDNLEKNLQNYATFC